MNKNYDTHGYMVQTSYNGNAHFISVSKLTHLHCLVVLFEHLDQYFAKYVGIPQFCSLLLQTYYSNNFAGIIDVSYRGDTL